MTPDYFEHKAKLKRTRDQFVVDLRWCLGAQARPAMVFDEAAVTEDDYRILVRQGDGLRVVIWFREGKGGDTGDCEFMWPLNEKGMSEVARGFSSWSKTSTHFQLSRGPSAIAAQILQRVVLPSETAHAVAAQQTHDRLASRAKRDEAHVSLSDLFPGTATPPWQGAGEQTLLDDDVRVCTSEGGIVRVEAFGLTPAQARALVIVVRQIKGEA